MAYVLSLMTPAIAIMDAPLFSGPATEKLLFGWDCLLLGWVTVPWLANPLLLVAAIVLALEQRILARVFAVAALLAALGTLVLAEPDLLYPHVGYFAWLASMVMVLIATFQPASVTEAQV